MKKTINFLGNVVTGICIWNIFLGISEIFTSVYMFMQCLPLTVLSIIVIVAVRLIMTIGKVDSKLS